FVGKGLAYLIFCGVIFGAIAETRPLQADAPSRVLENWRQALGDRRLVIYLMANLFVPVYAAQLNSTLPLFLSQFVPTGNGDAGFSEQWISYFFVWHALLKIVLQLPVIRWLRPVPQVNLMGGAVGLWAAGLLAFWLLGLATAGGVALILIGFAFIAVAEVLYGTSATALVGEIAPIDQRGVYFALESECWAVGFLIGPAAGGWALDHPETGKNLWLVLVITAAIAAVLVAWLKAELRQTPSLDQDIHSS
ncbi:MAG: MFS transporter, partial [Cyanobacteria bacterium P01_D01_bin.128]